MYGMVLTTDKLIQYMRDFKWTRIPQEFHLHHTWKPTHHSFDVAVRNNGLPKGYLTLVDSMRNYHVNTNGWADIAQHLTLMPDGMWVTGRDFNSNPVSIGGRNTLGFMLEMVGNFDKEGFPTTEINSLGYDVFKGSVQQRELNKLLTFFFEFFNLKWEDKLVFHRDYSTKTCPGNGIENKEMVMKLDNKITKPSTIQEQVDLLWDAVFGVEGEIVVPPIIITPPVNSDFDSFKPMVKLEKQFGYYTKFGQSKVVQSALNIINKSKGITTVLAEDGHFGRGTESAFNAYKKSKGLPQNGLVDEISWKHLHYDLEKAQQNEDVKINWYDNQTKIMRVKRDEINFKMVKATKSVDSLINMMKTVDEEIIMACSGGLFGMSNGVTLSSLIVDGKIVTMGVYSRWAISQDVDGVLKLRGLNWENQIGSINKIVSAVGACPSLIVGGKENIDLTGIQSEPDYINNNHPRLCIGLDEEYFYFVVSHGRASLKGYYGENVYDMAKIGLAVGMIDMIMLDGGDSIQVRKGAKDGFERLDDTSTNRLVDNAVVLVRKK